MQGSLSCDKAECGFAATRAIGLARDWFGMNISNRRADQRNSGWPSFDAGACPTPPTKSATNGNYTSCTEQHER